MLKVFLVEDESLIREGLRDTIPWEQYGYEFVGDAQDGEMALPLIRKTKPDVLITDIKMPFMDGLSLSKIVNNELPNTKIIIISGYDDFEYARQAIELGATQYLLKPITKLALRKALLDLKEKIEAQSQQNDYQLKYQDEMHEYEQFSRRLFFEKMFEGELSVTEIYEEAAKLSIDLSQSAYNLLFFYIQPKNGSHMESEQFTKKQDEVLLYILRHPQYVLFRWNVNCYGVFIKTEESFVGTVSEDLVSMIEKSLNPVSEDINWYIAVSEPVYRLSQLPQCYQTVTKYMAYRFIAPTIHIINQETFPKTENHEVNKELTYVDPSQIDPDVIKDFLSQGLAGEIHEFVQNYLESLNEALKSRMFRDYLVLSIRFTIQSYLQGLGVDKNTIKQKSDDFFQEKNMESAELENYFIDMLNMAIGLRDKESDTQSKRVLHKAKEYMDEHYTDENISLNDVANVANVSANYLSAVFSQNMKMTFVEYITNKRIEHAKKLLRSTGMSSAEIASEIGYKDPHYFSFVFKKMQGVSPREYRSEK